jgi:hypothetical protein
MRKCLILSLCWSTNEIFREMFANEEDGFQFYNNNSFENRFSVRRSYREWGSGHNEMTLRNTSTIKLCTGGSKHISTAVFQTRQRWRPVEILSENRQWKWICTGS